MAAHAAARATPPQLPMLEISDGPVAQLGYSRDELLSEST
jgi:hypothetical protein